MATAASRPVQPLAAPAPVALPRECTFDTDQPVQAVYDFSRTVFEEDRAIVEVQKEDWSAARSPAVRTSRDLLVRVSGAR
jgi:hypothetical protein